MRHLNVWRVSNWKGFIGTEIDSECSRGDENAHGHHTCNKLKKGLSLIRKCYLQTTHLNTPLDSSIKEENQLVVLGGQTLSFLAYHGGVFFYPPLIDILCVCELQRFNPKVGLEMHLFFSLFSFFMGFKRGERGEEECILASWLSSFEVRFAVWVPSKKKISHFIFLGKKA